MLPECLENYAYLLAKCYCWHFDMERKAVQRIVMSMKNLQMQGFYCLAKSQMGSIRTKRSRGKFIGGLG